MAEDIRALILKNLMTTLETVVSINSVGFGTFLQTDKPRPYAGIIPGDEPGGMTAPGVRETTMGVTVRIVADESDEEAIFKVIEALKDAEAAMMADRTRGGYAQDTRYINTHWLFADQQEPQAGADLVYEIDKKTKSTDQTAIP